MTWTITEARAGLIDITSTETAGSTQVPAGTMPPVGTIVRAYDDVYGHGEFIYLRGVASTVPGDTVVYNPGYSTGTTPTTTRTVAASRGAVAVAMSSNIAGQNGWYQISGMTVVNGAAMTAGSLLYVNATAGTLSSTSTTAQKVDGAYCLLASGTPAAGKALVLLSRPSANGNS